MKICILQFSQAKFKLVPHMKSLLRNSKCSKDCLPLTIWFICWRAGKLSVASLFLFRIKIICWSEWELLVNTNKYYACAARSSVLTFWPTFVFNFQPNVFASSDRHIFQQSCWCWSTRFTVGIFHSYILQPGFQTSMITALFCTKQGMN